MADVKWERLKAVAITLGVQARTVMRWANAGYVEIRREGPALIFVKVYAAGPYAGRPIGLEGLESGADGRA